MKNDDDLLFDDAIDFIDDTDDEVTEPWKVLIVDDEEEVHRVTELSLRQVKVHERPIRFLHAYSGAASLALMESEPGIALVLMDVVMESEHAGLDAVQQIRETLNNREVRLVLRTGQPGQAPEYEVVTRYDINDYKEKTELTAKKLHTLMHTSLGHYRELMALKQNRIGLEKVIDASATLFESQSLIQFTRGVLAQLAAIVYSSENALMVRGLAASMQEDDDSDLTITATSDGREELEGRRIEEVLPLKVSARIRAAQAHVGPFFGDGYFTAHFRTRTGYQHIVYLASDSDFSHSDRDLIALFCRNASIAFENQAMYEEIVKSQHSLVVMLSSVVEERSKELKNHVRRVSEYAGVIGEKLGLDKRQIELLQLSAALHDVGKIGIPDDVLNKPGKLSPEERRVMEAHVERGVAILGEQRGELLKTAGVVIGSHHERWDGAGYPNQLGGENIHLFGRITAIADVFDALSTPRVYKEPWPLEAVFQYFREQRGSQFDPQLVDVFLDCTDEILAIYDRWYLQLENVA